MRCVRPWPPPTATRAARHAHAIAGSSGNLGADDLRVAAKALERAGREGRADELASLFAELQTRAAVVWRSIDTIRDPRPPGAPRRQRMRPCGAGGGARRPAAPADRARQLRCLGGGERARRPRSRRHAWPSTELATLRDHIDSYEYDEARVLVSRLLERDAQ